MYKQIKKSDRAIMWLHRLCKPHKKTKNTNFASPGAANLLPGRPVCCSVLEGYPWHLVTFFGKMLWTFSSSPSTSPPLSLPSPLSPSMPYMIIWKPVNGVQFIKLLSHIEQTPLKLCKDNGFKETLMLSYCLFLCLGKCYLL